MGPLLFVSMMAGLVVLARWRRRQRRRQVLRDFAVLVTAELAEWQLQVAYRYLPALEAAVAELKALTDG